MGVYQGQNKIFQVQIILFLLFNFADNCNISLMQFYRKLYYFIYSILQTTILFSIIQFCRQLYYFQFCRQLFFFSQLFNFLDNYIIFNYSILQTTILFLIIQFCRQLYFFQLFNFVDNYFSSSIIQFCRQLYYFQLFNFADAILFQLSPFTTLPTIA